MVIKNRLRDNLKLQTTPMSFDECEKARATRTNLRVLFQGCMLFLVVCVRGSGRAGCSCSWSPCTVFGKRRWEKVRQHVCAQMRRRLWGSLRRYCRHRRKIAASYEKVDVSSLAKGKRERLFEAPAEASDVAQADQEAGPIDVDDSGVLAAYDGTGSDTDGVWDLSGYDSGGLTGDDTAALEYSAEEYAAMTEALVVYMKRYDYESGALGYSWYFCLRQHVVQSSQWPFLFRVRFPVFCQRIHRRNDLGSTAAVPHRSRVSLSDGLWAVRRCYCHETLRRLR
jgi:hypothetical protein